MGKSRDQRTKSSVLTPWRVHCTASALPGLGSDCGSEEERRPLCIFPAFRRHFEKDVNSTHTYIYNIIVLHMYLYRCCMRIHVYNVYIVYVTIWWCDDMWWFIELEASKCSSCKGLYRCRRRHRRLPPPHHPPPYPPHPPHPPPPHHHYHHRNHLTVVIRIIHW